MLRDLKTLLILNPAAGKGAGKKYFDGTTAVLKDRFTECEARISERPGHIYQITREAVRGGVKRLIVIGGDGSAYEVLNGICDEREDEEIELGLLPAGTGNSFLRDFTGISFAGILEAITGGHHRRVDVGQFEYDEDNKRVKRYFLNILGVGLIADILKLTNEKLKFLGSFGYSLAVLLRLFKGIHNRITLTVDGVTHHLKDSALVISNSKYTGGKMKIAPMASTEDGEVDVIVFNEVGRLNILNIFARVFKGLHVEHKKVRVFKGSDLALQSDPPLRLMADGELLGTTPLRLKVLPGRQTILL